MAARAPSFGYTLMGEEHGPRELVAAAERAEAVGFDFLVASDHYHPWVPEQRHSPYVWTVLGAVAARTRSVELATMVTCPIIRYHPAIVAQKAATLAVLSEGRFTLGVGSGERLNEHVVGEGWPPVDVRQEMLEEAVDLMRLLWEGGYRTFRGEYFAVEDARIFDLPEQTVPVAIAVSGPWSVDLAATAGDGLIAVSPSPDLVDRYRAGGGEGPTWCQIAVCWAADRVQAMRTAHERSRWSPLGWKVMSELPNPVNFDAATRLITPEQVAEEIPCGPDPEPYVEAIRAFTDAGFERVALLQIGDDQEGFFRFWEDELQPHIARSLAGAIT
ncbi:MAG TPA: TIGR03557 family F420-dependent LLM class oxidoreductase [Actinomycetota bacterium]